MQAFISVLKTVIPAKAGTQRLSLFLQETKSLGSRFRGNDVKSKKAIAAALWGRSALLPILLALSATTYAQSGADPTPLQFQNRAEETRFHALVAELRCVMCQNQSLADSNAQIAHDLRREVLTLMRQGKDDTEIKDFLVARYGEFVLYRPRVESTTWLLWFGPIALLLAGGALVAVIVRRRSGRTPVTSDDKQEW
jgi:cytochrome c-type biogenesis protein CcmH